MSRHIILGAFGHLGSHVAKQLSQIQQPFISVSRGIHSKRYQEESVLAGDICSPGFLSRLCLDGDRIYLCSMPKYGRWAEEFIPMIASICRELSNKRVTLVYADNLYMYGFQTQPMHEKMAPKRLSKKGRLRLEAASLLQTHKGNWNVVICRGADFFGPQVRNALMGEYVFASSIEGKSPIYVGRMDTLHSFTFIEDFASSMIKLANEPQAIGHVWHAPSLSGLTANMFIDEVKRQTNNRKRTINIVGWKETVLGHILPSIKTIQDTRYQRDYDFSIDDQKYINTFGEKATGFELAISKTIQAFRDDAAEII